MTFSKFASLSTLLVLVLPSQAIISNLPYHMQSFNPSSNTDDGTNFGTGNCWTAASNANGAAVTLQKCQGLGTASQAWSFTAGAPAGEGTGALGNVKIFGNKCLDVKNGADASGTKLQIWTCGTANKNQQFQVSTGDAGVNTIKWANSTRCIDLTGGSQSGGTPLQIWTCSSGNTHQEWINQYAASSPPSQGSTLRFHSALQPGATRELCITAAASGVNNDPVFMEFCDIDGPGLNWIFNGDALQSPENSLCLDVTNGANVNGTPLQVYKCDSSNKNQRWAFTSNYQIQWVGTNKCIDLTDGKLNSGTRLQIWTCSTGNTHQEWEIDPVATS